MTEVVKEMKTVCEECGTALVPGPLGPQCMHCLFSLGTAEDAFEGVAEFFPELSIQEKIARGGFGTVFRAEQRRMKRQVALKFLDSVLANSPEAVSLFEKEMVTVGGLDHPGIVKAHDAGERDGHWYIVMEFVDGADCGALVRKHGMLPIAESCEIIRQAALALHHAHGKGLVHRDVKPGNLMIAQGTQGTPVLYVPSVKVLDFGLANIAVSPLLDNPAAVEDDSTGDRFLGTLEYVAPEQIEAPAKVDARADIYALGATLRRFLTGKPAREGASEQSLVLRMKAITSTAVPAIAELRPDLPPALAALCDQLVALDRNQRPPTAAEVAELLHPWCAGAELSRLFTDGPLPEKPFVFPKKNRRPLWAAAAALVAVGAFLAWPKAPTAPLPYRPLFPAAYFEAQKISPDSGPRLVSEAWEPESVAYDVTFKQYGRLTPDGAVLSVDAGLDNSIRLRVGGENHSAFKLPTKRPAIYALGVAPDGHVVWAMPQDKTGLHIGRAKPDGTLLPTLRYDFGPDFSLRSGLYELGRQALIKMNIPAADGEPRGFAFVTSENLPANTGLQPGDVLVADYGQRVFLDRTGQAGGAMSIPGLWRFRLDDDAPVRRLAKASTEVMPLDVTISKHGVFIIDRAFHAPNGQSDDPRHLTDHVWRWDLDGWHSCTTDLPLLTPCGIAADPLSADLYVLCGHESLTTNTDRQSLLRLTPSGPDRYTVTPVITRLGKADRGGIAFSTDGKRMILTDSGNRIIVVLKRPGTPPATISRAGVTAIPAIPGWKFATNLQHTLPFTSPQFLTGSLALYCSKFRLRVVEKVGAEARNFIDENTLEHPTFVGVSPLTGHVAWTQTKDSLQPGIGRATADGTKLASLKFADPAPPVPGSFAFVTAAPPGLRPGDVLISGSRHPGHPESASGVWRFRFDNDEPPDRLVAISDAAVNDITVSKAGVFLLTASGLQRWDGTALHPIATSQPLQSPVALAADPLSSDLFLLETRRLLRLSPGETGTYTVEVLTTEITQGVAAGLCFSADGKRLLLGDYGSTKTWVLERKD